MKVGIVGVSGLTGELLFRLLLAHKHVEVVYAGSEHAKGERLDKVLPQLLGLTEMVCADVNITEIESTQPQVVFMAKPHTEALHLTAELINKGFRVIDLSGDYRLKDPKIYKELYKIDHPYLDILDIAVYGISELYKESILGAHLVANPGCYATGAILALAPLLRKKMIDESEIILIEGFSGLTGSGKKYSSKTDNLFLSCYGNVRAYSTKEHHQLPEIVQQFNFLVQAPMPVKFIPHIIPTDRGIYLILHVKLKKAISDKLCLELYNEFYQGVYFVRVRENFEEVRLDNVVHTNFIDIGVDIYDKVIVVNAALDNLGKGAVGQAVQNLNIMIGVSQMEGLLTFL